MEFSFCQLASSSGSSAWDQPTAVTLSPCAVTARTTERPKWPVAPNIYRESEEAKGMLVGRVQSSLLALAGCRPRAGRKLLAVLFPSSAEALNLDRATMDPPWLFGRNQPSGGEEVVDEVAPLV